MLITIGNWFNWFGDLIMANLDLILIIYIIYNMYIIWKNECEKKKYQNEIEKLEKDIVFFKTIISDEELSESYRKLYNSLEEFKLMEKMKRVGEIYG